VENYTVVLHGLEAWYRHSWLTRKAARGASCIVATTTYTAREFCYLNGLDAKRCIVIPLATDSRTPAMLPAAPEGHMRLLAVSRLSTADRYKGIDILLRAIRMGLDEGLALRLDIVGDGNDASRLKDLTERLGIQNSVTFRGSVPDEDLDQLYRSSHVFVMPSKKEGFGIVFLEAMAVGLPCIGGNHGGTPEVIHHGVSGYLVEFGDIEQLVFYFRVIGESAELYSLLSRAARHRAMRVLGFDNMAKSWDELIDRLKALGNGNSNAEEISPSCPAPEES
jgi:glycosyltransferase involved in cell wall biosynthesis